MLSIDISDRQGYWYHPLSQRQLRIEPQNADGFIYFASALELRVYKDLVRMFGIKRVVTQVPVLIYPAQHSFKALNWRVDFGIKQNIRCSTESSEAMKCLIEVKGDWVKGNGYKGEFLRTLMMCEQNNPDAFSKLLILGESQIKLNRWLSIATIQDGLNYLSSIAW